MGAGGPNTGSPDTRVRAIFVRQGTADEAMISALRNQPKGSVTLVTDDRELRGRAKQLGANTCGVGKFMERLDRRGQPKPSKGRSTGSKKSGEKPTRVSKKEVEDWINWFGFDEKDLQP